MLAPLPSRRQTLQIGTVGYLGATLPRALSAEQQPVSPRARACILIYLDGGLSHLDLLDLKPSAPAEIRGPYTPIPTSVPGIEIGELLPLTARQIHQALVVRSLRHEELVHDPAVYQMLTGYKHLSSAGGLKVEETDLPHLAAAFTAADRRPTVMPRAIQLPELMKMEGRVLPGQNAGILGATFDPFLVELDAAGQVAVPPFTRDAALSETRFARRRDLLARFNRELQGLQRSSALDRLDGYQQQALNILAAPSVQQAFELAREPAAVRERYGRHRHGQSVLLARRLVEAGARFVTVYWGREPQDWGDGRGLRPANNPWDTHRNHFPLVTGSLAPRADQALSALLGDLADRGLLAETLVVWMGDFGRTPRISKPWASRDHWPHACSLILAGGGLRAGEIVGATDSRAAYVTERPLSPADLAATILATLGIDPARSVPDRSGKPHRLATGRIAHELWA